MAHDDDLIFRSRKPAPGPRAIAPREPAPAPAKPHSLDSSNAWWTIPALCIGLAVIAWCVLIPACNANRKLVLEREKLRRDLEAVDKQISVNDRFLTAVAGDPELAQRLAQRQMKFIPEGTTVLDLPHPAATHDQMSPFLLTAMPRPAPLAQLSTEPGFLGRLSSNSKLQLYMIGLGLLLLAASLVMGGETQVAEEQ